MNRSNRLLFAFLLSLFVAASVSYAQTDVYLYDPSVVGNVNIGEFVESGRVFLPDGSEGDGAMKWVYKGYAPEPYPQVHVWDADIERLGASCEANDGLRFINHGTHWVKNRLALVLWTIEVPNAASRMPSEFEKDITLSFWVDWNQDMMWSKDEKVILSHINLQNYFPTTSGTLRVQYLTSFRVPDIDGLDLNKKPGTEDPPNGNVEEVINLWVRGIVSYDDPDVSPDGEQVFGEVEDYRVAYMKTPRSMKE